MSEAGREIWSRAVRAAHLLAADPAGLGGLDLRAGIGPVRDAWLALLQTLVGETALRKMPAGIDVERLTGGLDLAATLARNAPVMTSGFLAEAAGRIVLVAMAERLPRSSAAHLAAALDGGDELCVVTLDEGEDEERTPAALRDRLALALDLRTVTLRDIGRDAPIDHLSCNGALRKRASRVRVTEDVVCAFCTAAVALGIDSLRVPLQAVRVARLLAALAGRDAVDDADAREAAALVLAPRATQMPAAPQDDAPEQDAPDPDVPDQGAQPDGAPRSETPPLDDVVLEAARAALPPHLLARLNGALPGGARSAGARGKAGAPRAGAQHGRRIGTRAGLPRGGAKIDLLATLRAAAPWQRLRAGGASPTRILVRRDDIRLARFEQRTGTTTIFLVDASGSAARERLAEAKGAVRLMLADCYIRRDDVALMAFRGTAAELLLPPTRSLVRAERALAGLPGGGGTPLATALEAAAVLAQAQGRSGRTPTLILMSDARANVTRSGTGGRAQAHADALVAARAWAATGFAAALLDTSAAPGPLGAEIAGAMGARYVPLPFADARGVDAAARALTRGLRQ